MLSCLVLHSHGCSQLLNLPSMLPSAAFFMGAMEAAKREHEADPTTVAVRVQAPLPLQRSCTAPGSCRWAWRASDRLPMFAQALLQWGGALLELAHFKSGPASVDTINDVGP